MTRLVLATLIALLVGAAPAGAAPAVRSAGACSGGGVTVVVDYHALGGGVDQRCDTGGGGRTASAIFGDVGIDLTYVQRQPGFVCRVQQKPSNAGCVNTPPADAYWGLYWSDGKGGSWTYASTGVGGLDVPEGGSVGFAWQSSTSSDPPGVAPRRQVATSKPTAKPTPRPTPGPAPRPSARPSQKPAPGKPTVPVSAPPPAAPSAVPTSAVPSPTATSSVPATPSPVSSESASVSPSPSADGASPAAAAATPSSATPGRDGGVPWWVPIGLVVLLAGGGLGAVALRRRSP